jgi:hypothetical protein
MEKECDIKGSNHLHGFNLCRFAFETKSMTDPEVTNPCPTGSAVTNTAQPVRNDDLQLVVERAQDQLRQLTLQRQEIAQKIAVIKRTINGLALLSGGELQCSPEDNTTKRKRGITNACRVVLNRTDTPLSVEDIYAILQEEFPDLYVQTRNYYASLVTTLNRLVNYGEARTFLRNGIRFWQRQQPVEHQSDGLSGT